MGRTLVLAAQMLWFGLATAVPMYGNDLFEGDSCVLPDGVTTGTCRRDFECDYLKTIPKSDWKRCSFVGNVSIVCCRDKSPSIQGSANRLRSGFISERMCDGFPPFSDASNHIFNGILADVSDFPYLGAIAFGDENDEKFGCGASLISREYMLTAAHCVTRPNEPKFVRLGVTRIFNNSGSTDDPVDVGFEKVIIHPDYKFLPLANDIALLKLNRTIDEDFLIPACLYTNSTDPGPHTNLSVAGWGSIESIDFEMSADLMKAHVNTFEREECNTILQRDKSRRNKVPTLRDGQLCAIGKNATGDVTGDTCIGDSGGPLELAIGRRRYIVGLTSTGKICGTNYPGIYTRVSHFIDWIESVVWPA